MSSAAQSGPAAHPPVIQFDGDDSFITLPKEEAARQRGPALPERLYDRALTAEEVAALHAEAAGYPDTLRWFSIASWHRPLSTKAEMDASNNARGM